MTANLAAIAADQPVTVETVNGSRYYGHGFTIRKRFGSPVSVSVTVENGTTVVPWHSVALVHAHTEEEL